MERPFADVTPEVELIAFDAAAEALEDVPLEVHREAGVVLFTIRIMNGAGTAEGWTSTSRRLEV